MTARAFGADEVIYTGQRDRKIEARIKEITQTWGGPFEVMYSKEGAKVLKSWKKENGEIIHLTMYGVPIQNLIKCIRNSYADKLIVVGGQKVPKLVYETADWNIAVTSQPHSEISALSVFFHEFFEGMELTKNFLNAKLIVVPQEKGKKVIKKD